MPGRLLLSPWPREALLFAGALERAGRLLLIARRGLSAGYGLTVTEWRMLRLIGQGRHELSVAALARRILVVSLTGAGERWLAALDSAMRALLLEVTSDLSPQKLELMTDALVRVSHRLRACRSIVRASRRQRRRPHPRKTRHLC